jgi:hypothetical protein
MKLVYIAGPYSGGDYLEIDTHIAMARTAAAWLAEHGIGFICPHLNSAHFEAVTPEVPNDYWYQLGVALLQRCDAILLLPGWEQSVGSLLEVSTSRDAEIPVFYFEDERREELLNHWMRMEAESSVERNEHDAGKCETEETPPGEAAEEESRGS